jgi:hypothetical protein
VPVGRKPALSAMSKYGPKSNGYKSLQILKAGSDARNARQFLILQTLRDCSSSFHDFSRIAECLRSKLRHRLCTQAFSAQPYNFPFNKPSRRLAIRRERGSSKPHKPCHNYLLRPCAVRAFQRAPALVSNKSDMPLFSSVPNVHTPSHN